MSNFLGTLFIPVVYMASLTLVVGCAAPFVESQHQPADFLTRCSDPQVIRCFGFEASELAQNGGPIAWSVHNAPVGTFVNGMGPGSDLSGRMELTNDHNASGQSSLQFFIPSQSGPGFSGQFYANFSDDYSIQFGEGDEFYIQWRQRFSTEFLKSSYFAGRNWKQVIVGMGNRDGNVASSCTQIHLVVNQGDYGYPAMYHSCRGKDGRSAAIYQKYAVNYVPNQWMTFQLHVKIGTWYQNDRRYRNDSLIELWVGEEGMPSRVAISEKYDLANTNPLVKYGKVWLLPYLTAKNPAHAHPDAYTWYDDLIISKAPIPDPIK